MTLVITILLISVYFNGNLKSVKGQIDMWKKYSDPGQKFSFLYPPSWLIKSMHDNITGTTSVILGNPNSSRAQVQFFIIQMKHC